MRLRALTFAVSSLVPVWLHAQGTVEVRFGVNEHTVLPGQTFTASVQISPIPPGGLFSYGVQLLFDPLVATLRDEGAITVPADLNFNGPLGVSALRMVAPGFGGVKGSVDPTVLPPQGFTGSALASFEISNLSEQVGQTYEIRLGLFQTLGSTESVFVTGLGEVLDNRITFGRATISVVPEPTTVTMFALGGVVAVFMKRSGRWRLRRIDPAAPVSGNPIEAGAATAEKGGDSLG